ncbi:serine hydrolase domain-containing protein [Lysinibacillus fusiformis]|uniref:serine hydrolase domain-containing protein n=1 Tax=Lysinibacillus fusiformis TaxID=28031 RepID=UPI002EC476FF|nr:serine hydrolase domain-containing protein [Lysinibacillus fusiformis]
MKLSEELEQLFMSKFEQGLFSGNILVAKEGKPIYIGTFGLSNYHSGKKLSENSLFELASVTKPMTAMGIMILEEQGKLNYDDTIKKWIPSFPYETITLRHALTHTSGLPDYMELFESRWDHHCIATNRDVLRLLTEHRPPLYFDSGEKYQYSNTGYVCLAMIIEKVSDMSYAMFMLQHIFKPSAMQRTRVMNRRYYPEDVEDFAFGYIRDENSALISLPDDLPGYEFVNYLDGIQGDGMIHSTIMDLLSLDRALKRGDLLCASSLELALSSIVTKDGQKTPCGFGWFIDQSPKTGKKVFHSGGWPGYTTMLCCYIETDYTIIILNNVEYHTEDNLHESVSDWLQQIETYIFH